MSINHVRLYFQAVYVDCKDFLIGKKKKKKKNLFGQCITYNDKKFDYSGLTK